MAITLTPDVLQDDVAISLARAVAAANRHAHDSGVELTQSLITITQQAAGPRLLWRINYGPKDPVARRGGDLIIDVDPADASIANVLHGQ